VSGVRPADARWRFVTGIVDSQPGVAAVDEQSAALAAERRKYFSWVRARADERTLAEQQHAEQVEQALRRGEVPPPEPVDPWPAERHTTQVAELVARERELADARTRALAAARDQVLDEARTLYDEVIDEARPHVDALAVLARRVLDARSAAREAEHAHDAVAGVRRHLDWGPTPQVGDLVSAVQDDRDLLSPTFLPARGRLGLSGPGWQSGDPRSHKEPPLPARPGHRWCHGRDPPREVGNE